MSDHIARLFSSVTGLLATRFRLLGLELQEEMQRFIGLTLLVAAAAVFASMFLLLGTLLIIVLFWEEYRVLAVVVLTLVYGGLAAGCLFAARHRLQNGPTPFAAVAHEFEQDQAMLFSKRAENEQ